MKLISATVISVIGLHFAERVSFALCTHNGWRLRPAVVSARDLGWWRAQVGAMIAIARRPGRRRAAVVSCAAE